MFKSWLAKESNQTDLQGLIRDAFRDPTARAVLADFVEEYHHLDHSADCLRHCDGELKLAISTKQLIYNNDFDIVDGTNWTVTHYDLTWDACRNLLKPPLAVTTDRTLLDHAQPPQPFLARVPFALDDQPSLGPLFYLPYRRNALRQIYTYSFAHQDAKSLRLPYFFNYLLTSNF